MRYKEKSDGTLTLTYKGDLSDLSAVGEVGYEYVNGGAKSSQDQAPDKKVFSWNRGLSVYADDDALKNIDIIIDGETETIGMANVK